MIGDFHIHTQASDGENTPLEILERVKNANLDAFAITDHDTLKGSLALRPYLKSDDPIMITGIEISTQSHNESVHILGYFKNNAPLNNLMKTLDDLAQLRRQRADKINELLKEYFNVCIDIETLSRHETITRGSIGRALCAKYPQLNTSYIFSEMIGDGCKAYVPSSPLTPQEAIDLIHGSLGYAVLAHPVLLKKNNPLDIIKLGLDGIEAIYPLNKKGDEAFFKALARHNHIFYTAGSDYHGYNDGHHDGHHGNIGTATLANQPLERFLALLGCC